MFGKIKRAIKRVAGSFGGGSNVASAGMAFPLLPNATLDGGGTRQTLAPNMTVAPTATDPGGPGRNNISFNNPGFSVNQNTQLAQVQANQAAATISPRSISPRSRGNSVDNTPLAVDSSITQNARFSPESVSSFGGSSVVAGLPSGNSNTLSSNPGTRNLAGFADANNTYDSKTGLLVPTETEKTPAEIAAEEKAKESGFIDKLLGKEFRREDVGSSPEVQAEQARVLEQRGIVNNYTAQLNTIVAKQNADLLQLRETGSAEGVTEAVYGGQQAVINREAAIRALPIQAALAGAQGNLELAQSYLKEVRELRQEQVDNDYDFKKMQFDSIRDFVKDKDKKAYDALIKAEDRKYKEGTDAVDRAFQREMKGMGLGGALSILDIERYIARYPNAGIIAGDTEAQAIAKSVASESPEGKLRVDIQAFKESNASYSQVVKDINSTETIKDKAMALKIAGEVYGQGPIAPSKIEQSIQSMSGGGILTNGDIRASLRSKGFTQKEIAASSAGNAFESIISGINNFLN